MNNIIKTKNDDLIGYYEDLMAYFWEYYCKIIFANKDDAVMFEIAVLLRELKKHNKSFKLLRVSINNGMGQKVKELDIE